jgi:N-methylhydantoinase A
MSPARSSAIPSEAAPVSIGIDIGGTFVDAVVVAAGEVLAAAKAPSTPADPVVGVLDAIEAVARTVDVDVAGLLRRSEAIVHGTTVGLNTLLTRTGSAVGLLTTAGHEDALLIGRIHQKVAGLGPEDLIRVADLAKPGPIVPRWRIVGIDERIDAAGRIVAPLDEAGVARAIDALLASDCESIAIAFLWSFRNPVHERRAAEIVRDRHPGLPVSISSDIAPVLGEYERTAATVVNAYLRRTQARYLDRLAAALHERGFGGTLRMLLSSGGTAEASAVEDRPVETLRSGPVGGAIAVAGIGKRLGVRNLLATDMGGTSFDVGLVLDGRPEIADVSLAGRLHLAVPTVDVASIGAGGGSVAWADPDGGLHVGPHSVGADPGPACYGRGGSEPTVTDADVILGRLNPEAALGGRIRLDPAAAERAIEPLAAALRLDVAAAAAGVVRVADAKMADLIRRVTIERGHDPRQLLLVAYGGAAGLHAGAYGFDAGALAVVLPRAGSMLSALGLAIAEPQRAYRRSGPVAVPLDPEEVGAIFGGVEDQARSELGTGGRRRGAERPIRIRREIGFRYRRQTHEVSVPLSAGSITAARLEQSVVRFERAYARIFGPGTGFRAAGIEATSFRVVASVPSSAALLATRSEVGRPRSPRPAGRRAVEFDGSSAGTDVFDGDRLRSGDTVIGPAVIDWPTTTAVVHPGQRATIDALGHLHLERQA